MNTVNDLIGLHEHIEIRYYVDHYAIQLHTYNGYYIGEIWRGSTCEEALINLANWLKTATPEDIAKVRARKYPSPMKK